MSEVPRELGLDLKNAVHRGLSEEEIRLHSERYRVFIEEVADGFYEVDLRGNFTFFNDAMCRIFGYSRKEIQGRNYRAFMDEKNAQFVFEKFNTIWRTGQGMTDLVWEIRRKNGEVRVLEVSAHLMRNDQGERIGFRGIARDITERCLAEKALRESEKRAHEQFLESQRAQRRYRTLLDFMPDPVAVFNMDGTVSYVNPAFVQVFGWTLEELEGKRLPFVPEHLREEARIGLKRLLKEKVIQGFQTQRLTKDGRLREVMLSGALFYEESGEPSGQVVILRDVTEEKRTERINEALFRISMALPRFWKLEDRLDFIAKEVKELLEVEGASVILVDEERNEFYFPAASYDDHETGKRMTEIRFPADKGIAGEVVKTAQALIVEDTSKDPRFLKEVDERALYNTRNMMDVPIRAEDKIIGVLCAVNKKGGSFDQRDLTTLNAIASAVAFPIENATMAERLKASYEEVQSLNRAKDRVIHHLSHELKTPLSVMSASVSLLSKRLSGERQPQLLRALERIQRNLDRLLEIQYQIEDIMRERDFRIQSTLMGLLEVCADELEALVAKEAGDERFTDTIRRRIEETFGLVSLPKEIIHLEEFAKEVLGEIQVRFSHREVRLTSRLEKSPPVWLPKEVARKIIEGLVRNAVENTPDGGQVSVEVRGGEAGTTILKVEDKGVGLTEESKFLVLKGPFTARETLLYSSKRPYDFNAGGKGLDLFRMKIFSERYGFNIRLHSQRCPHIPSEEDACAGSVHECQWLKLSGIGSCPGGTKVVVEFHPARDLLQKDS